MKNGNRNRKEKGKNPRKKGPDCNFCYTKDLYIKNNYQKKFLNKRFAKIKAPLTTTTAFA
jgi:hypothetical protein